MPSEAHEQVVQAILDNPTPSDASMADVRAGFDQLLLSMPVPDDVVVTTVDADGVPLDWVSTPGADERRVLLQTHGGGYCMGSARTYREFASRLARAARARVAVVDYRLAPEAPFPAGIDDCVTAYRWLLRQGVAAGDVVLVGDSGGSGLALATAARIRDEGLEVPAGIVAFAPWIDLAIGDSIAQAGDVGDPMSTREGLGWFAGEYLAGRSARDPTANVLYGDPRGLPPVQLLAGTRDIGYGDALRFARSARDAGVPVTVQTFHGLIHNWQMFTHLPEAAEAVAAMAAFVSERVPDQVLTEERVK